MDHRLAKRILYKLNQSLSKGKYRSIVKAIFDSNYRNQVLYVNKLVALDDRERMALEVSLNEIDFGHDIVYHDWVKTLINQVKQKGYTKLPMIDVIWDAKRNKYVVVDGNHRLAALKSTLHPAQYVYVHALVPASLFSKVY